MNRRKCLLTLLGSVTLARHEAEAARRAVELHLDLEVDPLKEREMVENYHQVFQPAIRTQPGFLEVRLLKLRETLAGESPGDLKYRLVISFDTEEHRKLWVATEEHQRAWPTISDILKGSKYSAALYDAL